MTDADGDGPEVPEVPEGGTWCDTYALHFPRRATAREERFVGDVGTEGYDRGTGVDVPKHPRLKRPGEKAPAADPFAGH